MSSFELRAIDRSKLYTSIVDQLVEGIRQGGFPPGAALPAERVLAGQLGVSRSSLREAIRVLEHAGVLEVRTGSGTYVSDAGASNAAMLRAKAAMLGDHSPLDVIAARLAIEPLCAGLAAQNRKDRDLAAMHATVAEQAALISVETDPIEVDLQFHVAIAVASNNPVLVLLMERLIDIMRQSTWRELKHRSNERRGTFVLFLEQHRAILAAVEAHDARQASLQMREHLTVIESGLLGEISQDGTSPAQEVEA
jgi:GntR family transcriptional repressor for pyruvate dehydrogenase complex